MIQKRADITSPVPLYSQNYLHVCTCILYRQSVSTPANLCHMKVCTSVLYMYMYMNSGYHMHVHVHIRVHDIYCNFIIHQSCAHKYMCTYIALTKTLKKVLSDTFKSSKATLDEISIYSRISSAWLFYFYVSFVWLLYCVHVLPYSSLECLCWAWI